MIDAVFDTNIYFQGVVSPDGPAGACWKMVEDDRVRVYVTNEILIEVDEILKRPKIRRQFPILTDARVKRAMKTFRAFCEFVDHVERKFELPRDLDDEVFINLALTLEVNFLVSRDKDLLDLRLDSEFSNQFPDLKIVSPVGFLEAVRTA